jgi:hypothetical protein
MVVVVDWAGVQTRIMIDDDDGKKVDRGGGKDAVFEAEGRQSLGSASTYQPREHE